MAAIHVRNVPENVATALRERAARHGRSMQQELLLILEAAATGDRRGTAVEPVSLRKVRTQTQATWRRDEVYGDSGR